MPSAYLPMIGGVEELTRHLACHLVRTGDEVEVWTPRPAGTERETEIEGIRIRRFDMPLPPAQLKALASFPATGGRALLDLLRAARRFRPDVLHVQCFSVNGAYATAVSRLTGIPVVITLQGETFMDDADIFEHSVALRTALRAGLRRARGVTGCSQFVLDDASARFGLDPNAGQVIFNGVELAEDESRTVDVPFERFVVCLGRVVRKKGFDLLLNAFPAIAERLPEMGLVVGGCGPYLPQLEAQARSLGIASYVHFAGPLDRSQVNWVLREAEVFVMPSRVEPFGIVALEAWRAGCPVVVTSTGGAPEFVRHGHDAMVCDPTDATGLAETILALLTDPERRSRLAANGSMSVRGFDWAIPGDRYRRAYEQAMASTGVSRRRPRERDEEASAVNERDEGNV